MHDKNMNGIEHPPKCKLDSVLFQNLLRCAWSADGSKITAGSGDRYLYIWDTTSRRILYKLPGHAGSVNDVAFHPTEPIGKSRAGGGSTMLKMHTVIQTCIGPSFHIFYFFSITINIGPISSKLGTRHILVESIFVLKLI